MSRSKRLQSAADNLPAARMCLRGSLLCRLGITGPCVLREVRFAIWANPRGSSGIEARIWTRGLPAKWAAACSPTPLFIPFAPARLSSVPSLRGPVVVASTFSLEGGTCPSSFKRCDQPDVRRPRREGHRKSPRLPFSWRASRSSPLSMRSLVARPSSLQRESFALPDRLRRDGEPESCGLSLSALRFEVRILQPCAHSRNLLRLSDNARTSSAFAGRDHQARRLLCTRPGPFNGGLVILFPALTTPFITFVSRRLRFGADGRLHDRRSQT